MQFKQTSKKQKTMFIASFFLFLLIISEVFLIIYTNKKNKELISITQISTSIPPNKENKTYFFINPTRKWKEENGTISSIYNCSIYNNTKHDFMDCEITIKIPDDAVISTHWNCTYEIHENYLTIHPNLLDSASVPSMGAFSFGFIISSTDEIKFKSINYSGYFKYRISDFLIHNIIIVLLVSELTSILITLLVHNIMQKRIVALHLQKERDNQIIEQTMKTFVNFIDAKDEYTRGHSTRVALYAKAIAKEMGYDSQFQQDIYYMGLMHDIGKITIPDAILNKTSHLSTDEWEIIKMHTANGAKLLKDFNILSDIGDAALYHHERYDGKGYLAQIKGTDIPLSARIICVADSFDAMNTNRCYRLKYSKDRIIQEFERCSGKQFDPDAAKALISLLKDNKLCE